MVWRPTPEEVARLDAVIALGLPLAESLALAFPAEKQDGTLRDQSTSFSDGHGWVK